MEKPLYNEKGELHPVTTKHPWGEQRSWCKVCGKPGEVDDLVLAFYHCDGTPGCKASKAGSLKAESSTLS